MEVFVRYLFPVVSGIFISSVPAFGIQEQHFRRCPRGLVTQYHAFLDTVSCRSPLDCIQQCSQRTECFGVNVCPTGISREATCKVVESVLTGGCDSLTNSSSPLCFHVQKIINIPEMTTLTEATTTSEATTLTAESTTLTSEATAATSEATTLTAEATTATSEATTLTAEATTATSEATTMTAETTTTTSEATTTKTTTTEATTTELLCQNGGTPNGDHCNCTIEYGGRLCHRRIRDCSELFERGFEGPEDVTYMIQPAGTPAPYPVWCQFRWGGVTYLLQRTDTSNFNKNYITLRDQGIGTDPLSLNYFAGLEKLHQFTSQADYQLNLNIRKSLNYENFTIGPEATAYIIGYDLYDPRVPYIDGLAFSPPMKFSADGFDTNGCYTARGVPGWYGTDCSGYSFFTDGPFYWKYNASTTSALTKLRMQFVRKSPFYDE
ncbi:uncharacterized protein [Littorina saxatilis]|uniref:uncharacterized protein n=1 Tax=Littorina saxatilis TaxID=31220 RepID=UPI0038B5A9B0